MFCPVGSGAIFDDLGARLKVKSGDEMFRSAKKQSPVKFTFSAAAANNGVQYGSSPVKNCPVIFYPWRRFAQAQCYLSYICH